MAAVVLESMSGPKGAELIASIKAIIRFLRHRRFQQPSSRLPTCLHSLCRFRAGHRRTFSPEPVPMDDMQPIYYTSAAAPPRSTCTTAVVAAWTCSMRVSVQHVLEGHRRGIPSSRSTPAGPRPRNPPPQHHTQLPIDNRRHLPSTRASSRPLLISTTHAPKRRVASAAGARSCVLVLARLGIPRPVYHGGVGWNVFFARGPGPVS
ncbi:hypothetical protein EDC01DRAFT_666144 [Geopyxis carbonaria]|nr:hypothetical protein EDC01DRAFT_666144 [Geopyxis carbonaria]